MSQARHRLQAATLTPAQVAARYLLAGLVTSVTVASAIVVVALIGRGG